MQQRVNNEPKILLNAHFFDNILRKFPSKNHRMSFSIHSKKCYLFFQDRKVVYVDYAGGEEDKYILALFKVNE